MRFLAFPEEHENLYANSEETKPAIKPIRGQKGKRSKVKRGSKAQEQKDTGAEGEYGNVESRKVVSAIELSCEQVI